MYKKKNIREKIEEGKIKKYIKKNKCSKCRTPTQIYNTHTHAGGIAVWRGRNKFKIRSA